MTDDNKIISICTSSNDGFGHQLHGLFTGLIVHAINNYYFDGYKFLDKKFIFAHIKDLSEKSHLQKYMCQAVKKFIKINSQKKHDYVSETRPHEIWRIPKPDVDLDDSHLYWLDNVFKFNKIPNFNYKKPAHKKLIQKNIEKCRSFFYNEYLPPNRLDEKSIVFHIRMGDAYKGGSRRKLITEHNEKIKILIPLLLTNLPDYKIYIHTDDEKIFNIFSDFLENPNITIFKKNTNLVQVLSDFLYAKIFVSGVSSLSIVTTFLTKADLCIYPDNYYRYSFNEKNVVQISNYINKFT